MKSICHILMIKIKHKIKNTKDSSYIKEDKNIKIQDVIDLKNKKEKINIWLNEWYKYYRFII